MKPRWKRKDAAAFFALALVGALLLVASRLNEPGRTPKSRGSFLEDASARRARMRRRCRELDAPANLTRVMVRDVVYHRERRLLWCPVLKAASTTWFRNFIALNRDRTERQKEILMKLHENRENEVVHKLYPYLKSPEILESTNRSDQTRFLVVRHPFHRLVSSFRDKLERVDPNGRDRAYFLELYGMLIVQTYRIKAEEKFGKDFFSRWNNYGTPLSVSWRRGWRNERLPSFWEFVQFIIDAASPSHLDAHWRPISVSCSPCHLDYDFILKFEDLDVEAQAFITVAGLEDSLSASSSQTNRNRPSGMDEDDLTRIYFRQLSDAEVATLYNVFEDDFVMFGYEYEHRGVRYPPSPAN